ncbi:hypothetical protein BLOT_011322 [Blomia tropicalis]|nr:hypothetical protein BLOT_011322 [Blomia tropicalis]
MAGPVPSVAEDLRLEANRVFVNAAFIVELCGQQSNIVSNCMKILSPGWPDTLFRWMVGLRLACQLEPNSGWTPDRRLE